MRPYGFNEVELLSFSRAHGEMLREEWRRANSSVSGHRASAPSPTALRRVRMGAGHVLIELGRRLLPGETGAPGMAAAARRPDGC